MRESHSNCRKHKLVVLRCTLQKDINVTKPLEQIYKHAKLFSHWNDKGIISAKITSEIMEVLTGAWYEVKGNITNDQRPNCILKLFQNPVLDKDTDIPNQMHAGQTLDSVIQKLIPKIFSPNVSGIIILDINSEMVAVNDKNLPDLRIKSTSCWPEIVGFLRCYIIPREIRSFVAWI